LVDFKANTSYGVADWHSYTIELDQGRPDRYYPVRIQFPSDNHGDFDRENMIHQAKIHRRYASGPKPAAENGYVNYNGVHWLSMQAEIISTGGNWDGGPSWARLLTNTYIYRPAVAAIRFETWQTSGVIVWLRGGCNYGVTTSYPSAPYVFPDPYLNGIPQRATAHNYSDRRIEVWYTYMEQAEVAALGDEIISREASVGRSEATQQRIRSAFLPYGGWYNTAGYDPVGADPWDQPDFQAAVRDLAYAQGGIGIPSNRNTMRNSSLPIESDRRWLASAGCRYLETDDFPEREKGIFDPFTVDEPYVSLRLADYVEPSA